MPGRALVNNFIDSMRDGGKKPFKCIFHCVKTCEQEKTPYCIAAALINAMKGNLERGFAFCGKTSPASTTSFPYRPDFLAAARVRRHHQQARCGHREGVRPPAARGLPAPLTPVREASRPPDPGETGGAAVRGGIRHPERRYRSGCFI